MARTFLKGRQIADYTISLEKFENNFLQGKTWTVSSDNTAVIDGLAIPDGTVLSQAATVGFVKNLVDSNLKAPDGFATTTNGDYPSDYKGTGSVHEGDMFYVTDVTNGTTVGTRTVNIGDALVALTDNPGNTDANWLIMESNRDQATEDVKGVIEIATQTETDAGTDDQRAVTPLKLATYLSNAGIQSYQFGNGLSVDTGTSPDTVELGGTLTKNTSIDTNGFDITFGGTSGNVTLTGASTVIGTSVNSAVLQAHPDGTQDFAIADVRFVLDNVSAATREVFNELPAVTGGSTDVTLANTPTTGTERVYINGQRKAPGSGNDYTISGSTITFATALDADDVVLVDYKY